jgi:hypothetical protein
VIVAASLPMPARSFDGSDDPAVEADEATARAKPSPIKLHGVCARWLHCCLEASQTDRRTVQDGAERVDGERVALPTIMRMADGTALRCAGVFEIRDGKVAVFCVMMNRADVGL